MIAVDNFLPKFYQESIYKSIIFEQTPWVAIDNVSGGDMTVTADGVDMLKTQSGFYHLCYADEQVYSNLFYTLRPIIDAVEHYTQSPVSKLLRIRVGLFMKSGEAGSNAPHVDYVDPHKTLLYYVNDSDGDTIFYNELYQKDKHQTKFTVENTVSPKQGRAVLFDGLQYHSSSVPIVNDRRVTVNINFI